MVWTIAPISGTPSYTCLGNSVIRNKLNELDSAEISCAGTFTPDTVVQIKEGATILFQGYVKESLQEENGKVYKLTLMETAQDLKYKIVEYSGSRSFIRTGLNVGQLVDLILTGSGWVKGTADATAVTALGFYNATSSSSLYKLIKDMQGKYLWFTVTADGVTKQVWWGTYRTDRTGSPITSWISKQLQADSIDRNITKITVYGENSTIYGSAGSGTKEKVYKYSLAKTAIECSEVATKLLADVGTNKSRYVVTLAKTNTYFAGDLVRVSSVNYTVHDVERTQSATKLGIGAADISYRDTLGTTLEEINGSLKSPSQKTYDGGEQSVNASLTWKQNITVPDINNMTDFKIKVQCKKFNATSNVAAETEYLSDISQVNTTGSYTYSGAFGYTRYIPDSNGLACTGMTNGHQFGMSVMTGDIYNTTASQQSVNIQAQYKIGAGSWTNIGQAFAAYIDSRSPYTEHITVSMVSLTPGQADNTTVYVRWVISCSTSSGVGTSAGLYYRLQRVTRHKHSLTTQYTANPQPYAVGGFWVYVGGVLRFTQVSPVENTNYEFNITPYLVTGDNTLQILTDASANVNVTGSYYSV